MEEQLRLIESQLYKAEHTFPFLKERLLHSGELRAWYKYYRGINPWAGKHFMEENVFLMSSLLIWCRISEDGQMGIHSFKLDDILRVDRNYVFEDKTSQKLILSQVTATFKALKEKGKREVLEFKRPSTADSGDIEGFENLVQLLD